MGRTTPLSSIITQIMKDINDNDIIFKNIFELFCASLYPLYITKYYVINILTDASKGLLCIYPYDHITLNHELRSVHHWFSTP